ncbi:MAG TPA: hypothetical protein VHD56_16280 [Tepidisphaeraceae bacterium]|nr:hypothetical protein [Tepidisphaeraceae bacterium]
MNKLTTALIVVLNCALIARAQPIDREALVNRHNIVVHEIDPMGAMAVGNGEFAFNVDVTGLQSFPEYYEKTMPIGTLSNWGWHSFPNPQGFSLDKFKFTAFKKYDHQAWYPFIKTDNNNRISDNLLTPESLYLRSNAHKFGLGRIGLEMTRADGSKVAIGDLKNIEEKLDIWTGVLSSSFTVDGTAVHVQTIGHPARDEVAIKIESPLIAAGRLKVRIAFAYPSGSWGQGFDDWTKPDAHQTILSRQGDIAADFARTLDDTKYTVRTKWSSGVSLAETGKHQYLLSGGGNQIELTAWFAQKSIAGEVDGFADVQSASRDEWKKFWTSGGAIDLSGNDDPRAAELERRIVLSQYVTRVHNAGSLPPQETGLACNSWYGKFHMEMYWWHVAHFALWGRPELMERSLDGLHQILPAAQAMAKREGCAGAKWTKMSDPSGDESPSWVGPMLVWQQPHPVYLAELAYRAHKDRATLDKYKDIVFNTADYMATFMEFDPQRKQYVLGTGIGSADEGHVDYDHNLNPTMELGYWKWTMETAQQWRVRLGIPREELTDKVLNNIAPLPVRNGVYPTLEIPVENGASWMATWLYGVLPGRDIDKEVMHRTLASASASRTSRPQNAVTWGFPMVAMCAARMNEPEMAIRLLVGRYDRNPFLPSGYAYRNNNETPLYLPASGGWLSAAAMMATGWDGNMEHAPGFPKNWKVRYEGLSPMP